MPLKDWIRKQIEKRRPVEDRVRHDVPPVARTPSGLGITYAPGDPVQFNAADGSGRSHALIDQRYRELQPGKFTVADGTEGTAVAVGERDLGAGDGEMTRVVMVRLEGGKVWGFAPEDVMNMVEKEQRVWPGHKPQGRVHYSDLRPSGITIISAEDLAGPDESTDFKAGDKVRLGNGDLGKVVKQLREQEQAGRSPFLIETIESLNDNTVGTRQVVPASALKHAQLKKVIPPLALATGMGALPVSELGNDPAPAIERPKVEVSGPTFVDESEIDMPLPLGDDPAPEFAPPKTPVEKSWPEIPKSEISYTHPKDRPVMEPGMMFDPDTSKMHRIPKKKLPKAKDKGTYVPKPKKRRKGTVVTAQDLTDELGDIQESLEGIQENVPPTEVKTPTETRPTPGTTTVTAFQLDPSVFDWASTPLQPGKTYTTEQQGPTLESTLTDATEAPGVQPVPTVVEESDLDDVADPPAPKGHDVKLNRDGYQRYKGEFEDVKFKVKLVEKVDKGTYKGNQRQRRTKLWVVTVDGKEVGDAPSLREAKDLIKDTVRQKAKKAKSNVVEIPVSAVMMDWEPTTPYKHRALDGFKSGGEIPPVTVVKRSDGQLEAIHNRHILWAARELGLDSVKAIFKEAVLLVTAEDEEPVVELDWRGVPLAIEYRAGDTREGYDGEVTVPAHYGYFPGTEARDGDAVDFLLGDTPNDDVYIIAQELPEADNEVVGQFKVMLDFADREAAEAAFQVMWPDLLGEVLTVSAEVFIEEGLDQLDVGNDVTAELSRDNADLTEVFHGGRERITEIDSERLQERDAGFYGEGFYVSDSAEYAKKWYGPVVTSFSVDPGARILLASVDMSAAREDLVGAVLSLLEARLGERGVEGDFEEQRALLEENQIEWVHLVDEFAEQEGYDIVIYNSNEIVVKNPDVLTVNRTGSQQVAWRHGKILDRPTIVTARDLEARKKENKEDGESVGIFLRVPEGLAERWPTERGGDNDSPPHFTLLFVGEVPGERQQELMKLVEDVARDHPPFPVKLANGVEWFTSFDEDLENREIAHKAPDGPSTDLMESLHNDLKRALEENDFEIRHYPGGFKAHSTLRYCPTREYDGEVPEGGWTADEIEVWGWEEDISFPLQGDSPAEFQVAAKTIRPPEATPGIYYHGTSVEKVPRILSEGLRAGSGAEFAPAVANDPELADEPAVYLTTWLNQAVRYGIGLAKDQEPAVIEVRLDPSELREDRMDDPTKMRWQNQRNPWKPGGKMLKDQIPLTQFYYPGDIPPERIVAVHVPGIGEDLPTPSLAGETLEGYEHARQLYFKLKQLKDYGNEDLSLGFTVSDLAESAAEEIAELGLDVNEYAWNDWEELEDDPAELDRIINELHHALFDPEGVGYAQLEDGGSLVRLTPEQYQSQAKVAERPGKGPGKRVPKWIAPGSPVPDQYLPEQTGDDDLIDASRWGEVGPQTLAGYLEEPWGAEFWQWAEKTPAGQQWAKGPAAYEFVVELLERYGNSVLSAGGLPKPSGLAHCERCNEMTVRGEPCWNCGGMPGERFVTSRKRPKKRRKKRVTQPTWYRAPGESVAFTANYDIPNAVEIQLKPGARVLSMSESGLRRTASADAALVQAVADQAEAIKMLVANLEQLRAKNTGDYDAIATEDRLIVLNPEVVRETPTRSRWL